VQVRVFGALSVLVDGVPADLGGREPRAPLARLTG